MTRPKIHRLRTKEERNIRSMYWLQIRKFLEVLNYYPEHYIKLSHIKEEDPWILENFINTQANSLMPLNVED